jgi:YidC/Oxa1 family membrane protein insertase
MFTTLIVQPIFNLLTLIYGVLPGKNFGLAIVVFTIATRMILYPLVKKQLRHTKAIKQLQPELKKIKEQTKGNKQQETVLVMELYKEREIKPMAFLGLMVLQVVLFLALFSGLNRIVKNPQEIYNFSYPSVQNLSIVKEVHDNPQSFDNTLLGFVDLGRAAYDSKTGFYLPAFLMVLGSSVVMFFQIRQTSPSDPDARKLRDILQEAGKGKEADPAEMNAVMARNISMIMPAVIFVVSIGFPAALGLYWLVGNITGFLQQAKLLKQDEFALLDPPQAEVVSKRPLSNSRAPKSDHKTKSGVKVTTYTAKDLKAKSKSKKN